MIELSTTPTTAVLVVEGDLDLSDRQEFPGLVARVSGLRRQLLVVDLCRTTFLDSTGAAFLISLADVTGRRGGVTSLRGADDRTRYVLEVCGALDLFRVDADHRCAPDEAPGPWARSGR
ncbi:STAS domain-containing protein [Pseudokineococcus basanitobsidens]|uniref:STAS domain-containing protein n=1 Tax=Pseudokineococcus basanitobsidens TaxID=1926649 RepID=A0ABU8RLB9_9ACTN